MSKPQIDLDTAIGMLRQWLNEDRIADAKRFVTNEDIHHWLDEGIQERERLARIEQVEQDFLTINNDFVLDESHLIDWRDNEIAELQSQANVP